MRVGVFTTNGETTLSDTLITANGQPFQDKDIEQVTELFKNFKTMNYLGIAVQDRMIYLNPAHIVAAWVQGDDEDD